MNRDIQTRIADAIDRTCNGNKSEFCRRIGRDVSAVKDIVKPGGNAPSYALLYDILASDLGISPTWLMLGIGDMLNTTTPAVNIENIQTVNIGNWDELVKLLNR